MSQQTKLRLTRTIFITGALTTNPGGIILTNLPSLTWIQHDQSLVQLNEEDVIRATAQCEEGIICISCGLKREQSAQLDFRIIPPRGFFQRGEAYHVNDFVYILPSGRSLLLKIGQITRIKAMEKPPRVTVRVYGRFDSLVRKMGKKGRLFTPLASDEVRLLCFTLTVYSSTPISVGYSKLMNASISMRILFTESALFGISRSLELSTAGSRAMIISSSISVQSQSPQIWILSMISMICQPMILGSAQPVTMTGSRSLQEQKDSLPDTVLSVGSNYIVVKDLTIMHGPMSIPTH